VRIGFAGIFRLLDLEAFSQSIVIANRAHPRGFLSILRDRRKLADWMVVQKGFEPSGRRLNATYSKLYPRCEPLASRYLQVRDERLRALAEKAL
jgi:hypothetical protein